MSTNHSEKKFPEAILFDHDGTLVDTEPIWEAAKKRICEEHGTTWSSEDTKAVLGNSIRATLERLQQVGVDLPLEKIEEKLIAYMHEAFEQASYDFLPGISALLEEIKQAGIPCAIVTNATTSVAQATANKAPEGVFAAVIGDQQTTKPKPDPQPYLMGAEALKADPKNCIAIEDSPSGVRSATAAGMKVIIVPGEVPVPEGEGDLRLRHEELTLETILNLSNS